MPTIIEKAKKKFLKMIDGFGSDPYHLVSHVTEMERWANYITKKYPQTNKEIILLGAWLHDLGHYPVPTNVDHAIRSEQRAKLFLKKEKYPSAKTRAVLHCVRAHRCYDVLPKSLEAKIIACIDSASHMTDGAYLRIAQRDKILHRPFTVYSKMERDYRDLKEFPDIQNQLEKIYKIWKRLIKEYEKIDL